jgi:inosose dehydratase
LSIRYGVSPIAWANDDMPELGAGTTAETILADAAAIGFAGIELGRKFPREPAALKRLMAPYPLALIGGWWSLRLLERSAADELAALEPHLALLEAMGSTIFIAAECSRAVHGRRDLPLSAAPRLVGKDWPHFGARLSEVAARLNASGFRFAYHFHLGTVVERAEDVERLIANTDPVVGLVVDTGHAAGAGVDADQLIRRHPERVAHVHVKDIRRRMFDRVMTERLSFLDGVVAGMFTVPGDGDLDFETVTLALADAGYDGWIVVEAEQDPAKADPRTYAELGLRSIKAVAARAGL